MQSWNKKGKEIHVWFMKMLKKNKPHEILSMLLLDKKIAKKTFGFMEVLIAKLVCKYKLHEFMFAPFYDL